MEDDIYIDYNSAEYDVEISQPGSDYTNEFAEELFHHDEASINSEGILYLKESQLLEDRTKLISEATVATNRSFDETSLILMYYKWSYEKFCEEWFSDVDGNLIKSGILQSPLSKKTLKSIPINGDECLICFEKKNETFASLNCGHQFCGDCWKEYLKEKAKDFNSLLTTTCPQQGCNCIVYETFLLTYITDSISKEKLRKAILKNFTSANVDIKVCPNPRCEICIKTFNHGAKDITCLCGYTFCFKCYNEGHSPCGCDMITLWEKRCKSESENDKWMEANTKTCPHCKQKIEKTTGCNFMLCDKRYGGCGKAFCYVCEVDWAKHTQDHFKCNKYTDSVKLKEQNSLKIKQELKRYQFYFDRYINYRQAIKICDKKLRNDLEDKIALLISIKQLPLTDLKFLTEALNTVIKGKRILKNTYVFGYYMMDNQAKSFFEFSQGLLEKNADELNFYLEKGDLDYIIQSDDYNVWHKAFISYKNKVSNLSGVTLKYMNNMCQEIEEKFQEHINTTLYNDELKLVHEVN